MRGRRGGKEIARIVSTKFKKVQAPSLSFAVRGERNGLNCHVREGKNRDSRNRLGRSGILDLKSFFSIVKKGRGTARGGETALQNPMCPITGTS